MNELEISSNIIIDDVGEVTKHLARQLGLRSSQTVILDKIKFFVIRQTFEDVVSAYEDSSG